jgi:hypothetical protein
MPSLPFTFPVIVAMALPNGPSTRPPVTCCSFSGHSIAVAGDSRPEPGQLPLEEVNGVNGDNGRIAVERVGPVEGGEEAENA